VDVSVNRYSLWKFWKKYLGGQGQCAGSDFSARS